MLDDAGVPEEKAEELTAGVEEPGELFDEEATGTFTAMVDMVVRAALFLPAGLEIAAAPEAELEEVAAAEPEPAVAEPVEVMAEVVCEIDVAPEYVDGPGTW